jgi:hypothetical protein
MIILLCFNFMHKNNFLHPLLSREKANWKSQPMIVETTRNSCCTCIYKACHYTCKSVELTSIQPVVTSEVNSAYQYHYRIHRIKSIEKIISVLIPHCLLIKPNFVKNPKLQQLGEVLASHTYMKILSLREQQFVLSVSLLLTLTLLTCTV